METDKKHYMFVTETMLAEHPALFAEGTKAGDEVMITAEMQQAFGLLLEHYPTEPQSNADGAEDVPEPADAASEPEAAGAAEETPTPEPATDSVEEAKTLKTYSGFTVVRVNDIMLNNKPFKEIVVDNHGEVTHRISAAEYEQELNKTNNA